MEPDTNLYSPNENGEIVRDNSQKILSVLAAHQIALWEYDIPTGKCSFTDDYFRTLGLKEAGVIFKDINDFYRFVHPDDMNAYQKSFAEMLASESKTSQVRVRCIGEHKEVIWLEDHFLSYKGDDEGHPDKLLAYTVNVTSQCEKEQQIDYLKEYNHKIIEALPEFIFIFDDNFYITDVLMAPDTILLHPIDVLKGADGRTIYSEEVSNLFIYTIGECLKDGKLKEIEYPLEVEGVQYYFQARIAPFEENKVLALIHDIGDRVRRSKELIEAKRRAEDADKLKSIFLANMSHEIRTPLNAIVGFSDVLSAGDTSEEEQRGYFDIIKTNSDLLLRLINDILDVSRLEADRVVLSLENCNVVQICRQVVATVAQARRSNNQFLFECSREAVEMQTDVQRLQQVVINLLSNADKFTKEGTITLKLEIDKAKDMAVFSVTDTGCGIPPDKQKLVFERFEKLNEYVQGTGLGLSICKLTVDKWGGDIWIDSTYTGGARFIFTHPMNL